MNSPRPAATPALRAAAGPGAGLSMTRAPVARAMSAVSSLQWLATTTMSGAGESGWACTLAIASAIQRAALCAGMTTLSIAASDRAAGQHGQRQ